MEQLWIHWAGWILLGLCALILSGCASSGGQKIVTRFGGDNLAPGPQGQEVTIMAMHLLDTGYKFGGKNPEAGLALQAGRRLSAQRQRPGHGQAWQVDSSRSRAAG